jgi:hypothetical protein
LGNLFGEVLVLDDWRGTVRRSATNLADLNRYIRGFLSMLAFLFLMAYQSWLITILYAQAKGKEK